MSDNAIAKMIGPVFAKLFQDVAPPMNPAEAATLDAYIERRNLRADHVAQRSRELARQYDRSPAILSEAMAYATDAKRNPAVFHLLALHDDMEAMRLIRARMTEYLADLAADHADDEAWELFPDTDE